MSARFVAKKNVRIAPAPVPHAIAGSTRFRIHSREEDDPAAAAAKTMAVRAVCGRPRCLSRTRSAADSFQNVQDPPLIFVQGETFAPGGVRIGYDRPQAGRVSQRLADARREPGGIARRHEGSCFAMADDFGYPARSG